MCHHDQFVLFFDTTVYAAVSSEARLQCSHVVSTNHNGTIQDDTPVALGMR